MLKSTLLATVLSLAFVAPAFAANDFTCDEATMTKARADIDAMTDAEKKTTSMKEFEMALEEMKGSKLDDCQARMRKLSEKNNSGGDGEAGGTTSN